MARVENQEGNVPGVICAIRGGPASQLTIQAALKLAQEHQLTIYFLYVVNLDFLSHTSQSRVHSITEEMEQLGQFIVQAAEAQAHARGVEAQGAVRHGVVGEQIVTFSRDRQASSVVIGRPKDTEEESAFSLERLHQFAELIEQETGAKLVLAGEEA
jgi:nucleotide-binding universal stress UspA family protein